MAESRTPNSPVCFAHEADAYMGYATREEITTFLNELLEMEQALANRMREIICKISEDDLRGGLAEMLSFHERNVERIKSRLANLNG